MTAKERPWAVGHVTSGHEPQIRDRLDDFCDVYLPVVTRLVRPARMRRTIERQQAMLPGYLFVDLRTVTDYGAISDEPGFHYFVGHDGRPSRMSSDDLGKIQEIERTVVEAKCDDRERPILFFEGDVVRVQDGPAIGMKGRVRLDRHGNIWLTEHNFPKAVKWSDLTNLRKCG